MAHVHHRYGTLGAPRVVDVGKLLAAPEHDSRPALEPPPNAEDPAAYARAKAAANAGLTGRRTGVASLPRPREGAGPASATLLKQVSNDGPRCQGCQSEDPQIAASQDFVVEMSAREMNVFDRSLGSDLLVRPERGFWPPNPNLFFLSDPRVVYDAFSGRFYASIVQSNGAWDSAVLFAASQSPDPTGLWNIWQVNRSTEDFEQLKIGFGPSTILLTANDALEGPPNATWWVLQKSDVLAGAQPRVTTFWDDFYHFNIVPAIDTIGTVPSTMAVYNLAQGVFHSIVVMYISGTPANGNVTINEPALAITGTSVPPDARQLGAPPLESGDDRFQSAVLSKSGAIPVIDVAGGDGCVPNGDTTTRACIRALSVNVLTSTPSILEDADLGLNGFDLIYPAVGHTVDGQWYFTYTASSPATHPTSEIATALWPSLTGLQTADYGTGDAPFGDAPYGHVGWGNYSGLALDPVNGLSVWVDTENGAIGCIEICATRTSFGEFTVGGPTVPSVVPTHGSRHGGAHVDIYGDGFVKGGSTVSFGGTEAASVTFVSSFHLSVTTPAHALGPVDVQVTTANGASPINSGDVYTFDAIPAVTGVSPDAGPLPGGQSVTVTGSNFTGATKVTFGGKQATFNVTDDAHIVATTPPKTPFDCGSFDGDAADVKVTTPQGTNPSPGLYTYLVVPTVTSVVPDAGSALGGDRVTITGCGYAEVSQVKFGSTPAAAFDVIDDATISADTPPHSSGRVRVSVITPGGTAQPPQNCVQPNCPYFTFQARIQIAPKQGEPLTPVGVIGGGFAPGEHVKVSYRTGLTNPVSVLLFSDVADGTGGISGSGTIPRVAKAGAPGVHTVAAKGLTSGGMATTKFTLVPPSWSQFRREPTHGGTNPHETAIRVGNVSNLAQAWAGTTGDNVDSSPAVVNGVVYVGSADHKLYAFDAATGRALWTATTGRNVASSPAVANGVVYAGSWDGKLYAFDAAGVSGCSGSPKVCAPLWTATMSTIESSPTVANGVLYVGSDDGHLYAFDAAGVAGCSGSPKVCLPVWSANISFQVHSSPAVANGVVYVGAVDHKLYAFDAAGMTGCSGTPKVCAPLWTATTGNYINSSPAVVNGVVYVGSADHKLYAFDAAGVTGCSGSPKVCAPLWSATTGSTITSSPAVAKGVVYVGSQDTKLYAFDAAGVRGCAGTPKVCAPLWSATTGNYITSSPAVANGVVYVGSTDHKLYAFDATGVTGCSGTPKICSPLWSVSTGNAITSSPAVLNGVVYVGSSDFKLHAYALP